MKSKGSKDVYFQYSTSDGMASFEFRFVKVDGYIEIDIVSMPDYGTRPDDLYITHRKPSRRGGYMISIRDRFDVIELAQAEKWAILWAQRTWRYIKEGISF